MIDCLYIIYYTTFQTKKQANFKISLDKCLKQSYDKINYYRKVSIMSHQELFQMMLHSFECYYQQVMDGDFSQVCWSEGHHETYGIYDINYANRLKLCCYLLYCQNAPKEILTRLFEEECQNLETNSFQGIGENIKILTYLLKPSPEQIERVKNANFDCACGYEFEYQEYLNYFQTLENIDLEECLELAYEADEKEFALQFLDMLKKDYPLDSVANCRHLIYWNETLGRNQENEMLYQKILDFSTESQKSDEIISSSFNLVKFYTKQKDFQKAYQEFETFTEWELSDWYGTNLFRNLLECAMDLILADIPEKEFVWRWAKPNLKREIKNIHGMYGNLYQKSIQASEKINPHFAKKLQESYQLWKKIKKIS